MTSEKSISNFERKADLGGFGEGVIEYHRWLYRNIPKSKIESKREDYISPEEIELLVELTKQNP